MDTLLMERMSIGDLVDAIDEAYEELKYVRRKLRKYIDVTFNREQETAILEWLEKVYDELDKRRKTDTSSI